MYFSFFISAVDGIKSDFRLVELILHESGIMSWAIENTFSISQQHSS